MASKGGSLKIVGSTHVSQRAKKRRGISKNETLMQQAALAKYPPHGKPGYRSDREVAKLLGINVQAVPELIKAAQERNLFSIIHNSPVEDIKVAQLEEDVRLRYGLRRVLLVPGLPDKRKQLDVMERRNVQTQVIRSMARRVVEYLDALIADAAGRRETFTFGVAWGRTMGLIAERLRSTQRDIRFPGLEVVPIVGITCESTREPTEANVIAMRFAEAYQGQSSQLASPAFVPQNDVWILTQRLEQVRRMLKKLTTCDAVLTSMGPIPDDDKAAAEITLSTDPVLNEELFKAARTRDAVGEICFWLFNEQGMEVQTSHAAIGLGFKGLRNIATDPKRQVILVAGGDRRRFMPLRAALRARLASVLVTDTVTAEYLAKDA